MAENQNIPNEDSISGRVAKLLSQDRVKDAILYLGNVGRQDAVASKKVDECKTNYSFLIKYFLSGARDDGRSQMLSDIRESLHEVSEYLERKRLLPTSTDDYYAEARILGYRPVSIDLLFSQYADIHSRCTLSASVGEVNREDLAQKEDVLNRIFNLVWTLPPLEKETLKIIRDKVMTLEECDRMLGAQIVSALFLALNKWYDREKFLTLLSIYESSISESLAARSLTALILILSRYPERISSDRHIVLRLQGLKDSLVSYRRLREVVRILIRTRDTDRVTDKMRSEVIPGMMGLGPDMLKKLKEASEDSDLTSLEENPEWEEILQKSGLSEKLKELSEMQLEGADVMMFAFSNLKSFPFFRNTGNWFLPFTSEYSLFATPEMRQLIGQGSPLDQVLASEGVMCDSDKYSFLLGLQSMPESRRKTMAAQLKMQQEQMQIPELEIKKGSGRPEFDCEAERYVRNLYRFFKLYSKKEDHYDPFANPLDFLNLPVVGELMEEQEVLELVSAFYFKRGYYKEAIPMLRKLAEGKSDNIHLWEKLGYSIEKSSGNYKEALECYMKAELFNPDSRWLVKRIGFLYKRMNNWDMAEDYIRRAFGESDVKEDILEFSDVLDKVGKTDEALKALYKCDYLYPGDSEVSRRIALLETLAGNAEKGLDRIRTLSDSEKSAADYRLEGHIYLLKGDYASAAASYARTILPEHKHREWKRDILNELPLIERGGGNREDLMLVLESLL